MQDDKEISYIILFRLDQKIVLALVLAITPQAGFLEGQTHLFRRPLLFHLTNYKFPFFRLSLASATNLALIIALATTQHQTSKPLSPS